MNGRRHRSLTDLRTGGRGPYNAASSSAASRACRNSAIEKPPPAPEPAGECPPALSPRVQDRTGVGSVVSRRARDSPVPRSDSADPDAARDAAIKRAERLMRGRATRLRNQGEPLEAVAHAAGYSPGGESLALDGCGGRCRPEVQEALRVRGRRAVGRRARVFGSHPLSGNRTGQAPGDDTIKPSRLRATPEPDALRAPGSAARTGVASRVSLRGRTGR
jgi:hypothetical protein